MIIRWSSFISALLLIDSSRLHHASGFSSIQPPHRVAGMGTGMSPSATTRLDAATALLSLGDSAKAVVAVAPVAPSAGAISDPTKVGVLLLNLGGPETGEDVEGFLYNLFADPDIIRLPPLLAPLQSHVALVISKRRAPKSREAYDSIGGGSPILQYTRAQADLMVDSLRERHGVDASRACCFPPLSCVAD